MMGEERRQRIIDLLRESDQPQTGSDLSAALGVSRQVIVQDVAILRAKGESIVATPQGYMLPKTVGTSAQVTVLACQHSSQETREELYLLVDHGVKVLDAIVEHPFYGELRGYLMLESRQDVNDFLSRLERGEAKPLCSLTKGIHLHTVQYSRETALQAALGALRERGFLLED